MRQKTVTEKYRAVLEGKMAKSEFVRQMRQQYPMHVTQFNGFDDSVQILKNRGLLFEAPAEKKAKVYDERPSLPYSDEAFQRGIRYELEAAGIAAHDAFNIKLDDFDKAKKKAEDNLMKDPMHYLNLISGESSKVDKHDKDVPIKRGEGKVDVFNGMKKAALREGYTEEQINSAIERLKEKKEKGTKELPKSFADAEKTQIEKDAKKKAFGEAEEEIPFKKVYQADFDELKKFLLNKTNASHDAHVLDGVFYELFESAENLVDEQPGTSEIDAIFTVAENMVENYEEDGKDEEAAIAQDVFNIIKPIAMASENKVEEAPTGLEEVMVAALRKGFNEEQIVDAVNRIRDRKKEVLVDEDDVRYFEIHFGHKFTEKFIEDFIQSGNFKAALDQHPLEDEHKDFWEYELAQFDSERDDVTNEAKTIDVYGDGDVVVDISRATPEQERLINYEFEISEFNDSEEAQEVADELMNLNSADDVENYYANVRGWDQDPDMRSSVRAAVDIFRGIDEKKGKDHDGDGDIDSDDYMAAKDKAIKKAMGKEEQLKEAIKKIIKESLLKEAATAKLSDIGDKYGDYKGMQVVINDLENIVTDVESYFAKTRERVQNAMDKIGQVETPDGMKVGAFLAPAIETAFFKDLNPVRKLSARDIKLPQVKVAKFDDIQREAEAGIEEEPKQTVFSPVNEKKK